MIHTTPLKRIIIGLIVVTLIALIHIDCSNEVGSDAITAQSNDTQPPSIPASLSASNIAQTYFTLSWEASTDNVGVTGYEVYLNGNLQGSSTSVLFTVTDLIPSTMYLMTVRSRDGAGNWSALSSALSVTTVLSVSGTIYYVDASGNDSNDGLSTGTAW